MEVHRGQETIGFKSLQDMWSDSWTTLAIIGSTDCTPSFFFFASFASYIMAEMLNFERRNRYEECDFW